MTEIHLTTAQQGKVCRALTQALPKAFTTQGDFERLTKFELDTSLHEIINHYASLIDIAFTLVNWAESHGCLEKLIKGALTQNKGNLDLQEFYTKVWEPIVGHKQSTPRKSLTHADPDVIIPNHPTNYPIHEESIQSGDKENFVEVSEDIQTETGTQIEQVRLHLLSPCQDISREIQKYRQRLTEGQPIPADRYRVTFLKIKTASDMLQETLLRLQKHPLMTTGVSYQIRGILSSFTKEIETFGLYRGISIDLVSSLPVHNEMRERLATLERSVSQIDHLINSFCNQLDQNTVIDQSFFLTEENG